MDSENVVQQKEIIFIRSDIQNIVDKINSTETRSREKSLAITKLEEAKMWLGKELGNLEMEDLNAKREADMTK